MLFAIGGLSFLFIGKWHTRALSINLLKKISLTISEAINALLIPRKPKNQITHQKYQCSHQKDAKEI